MTESTLDRLDRDPGGARDYLAQLHVFGASRREISEKLGARFDIPAPAIRSISYWLDDDRVRELVTELKAAQRDVSHPAAGDDPDVKPPVNRAKVDSDLFNMAEEHPAWAELLYRDRATDKDAPETDYYGRIVGAPPAPTDAPVEPDDAMAVLLAGHETAEQFEADAISRLTPAERESIAHLLPA